jgi:undecaprenyl-diphosphatase
VALLLFASVGQGLAPGWDEALFRALNLAGTDPVLDFLMVFFTDLALPYTLALLVIPLWWRGHRDQAFDLLILLGVVMVVTEIVKYAVDRSRPCDVLAGVHTLPWDTCASEGDPSFPSEHASRVFAVAAFLAVYYRWPVKASALVAAILTGISRVYLGVHWPSDVLAGAALGACLAFTFVLVARRWTLYQKLRARVTDGVSRLLPKRAKAT